MVFRCLSESAMEKPAIPTQVQVGGVRAQIAAAMAQVPPAYDDRAHHHVAAELTM
ncbi:hypothetical protein OVY29_20800 [Sphingopyxis sp. SE2]|jgi:hypothetical protein|uniref:hypothetical protein n=1 Tax=unclassified Sphingopyxis TaxID=2614943 RepID=UPI001596191C|nr:MULTISPECIES: hypothetical protein [unclassified Sphingopyxis]MDT7531107.1 hypothetical protein [Sphingopyxis sp. SE2]